MSRIFLSHSSKDNDSAVALRDWLLAQGWDDVFLDLDPERGIVAGSRWERTLNQAALRCEAVLFVVSRSWLASEWCQKEFNLAHRLNKRLFGLLIDDIPIADLPATLTGTWQMVPLSSGRDHVMLHANLPGTHDEVHVTFSKEGLTRLRIGLERAGLDARFFAWPPKEDPRRAPYRGLLPLESVDAGIFFGREAPTLEALDRIRGMKDGAAPRFLVLLGASGAGKSSFLRAGLLPRLARDDRTYLVLPVIRPERAVISGDAGLLRALDEALGAREVAVSRAEIREAIAGGAAGLRPLLTTLIEKARLTFGGDDGDANAPMLVLAIDQGEELFGAEGAEESAAFLELLRGLLLDDSLPLLVLVTIRSDAYDQLQITPTLETVIQQTLSLTPMPRGAYQAVIEGPAARLRETDRALAIEPALTQALLSDIEDGGGRDALPLLAFTLERLYLEYGGRGRLALQNYDALGRIKGSIEAAVDRAFKAADSDASIPRDRSMRLALLRGGLIPWLAGIDPDSGSPRRRVARMSEIPPQSLPLIKQLVEQRLIATDVAEDTGELTIEPAHEALLRQWSLLQEWLKEDGASLGILEGVRRAAREWDEHGRDPIWLTHTTGRLELAERLRERPDLLALLAPRDRDYLHACRNMEQRARSRTRRTRAVIYALLISVIMGLAGWINQSVIAEQVNWFMVMRPYQATDVAPYVMTAEAERAKKAPDSFRECAKACPEMVVIPPGTFMMGSPEDEAGRSPDEGPRRRVTIPKPFAVSRHLVTFDDWDACVQVGGCPAASASGFGRGQQPVININWKEAKHYAAWLSRMTNRHYRLLTEAEWEYAARAGTVTRYWFGNSGTDLKQYAWYNVNSNHRTRPVGQKQPNAFQLYDMHGNVWQWVEDCYIESYGGAPTDGSARNEPCDADRRVARGGSWETHADNLRSARRGWYAADRRAQVLGFRLARTLGQ
jgi:formylglycine-generating enzyme required for sulfatase activity